MRTPKSTRLFAATGALLALFSLTPAPAYASFLQGDVLDTVADVLSWIVLFVAPLVGIAVFLLIHILPEKIAEKRQHPQTGAIQCLCLLSLVFGGMLWPIAWLWAYTKPVMYKLAYGTDKVAHGGDDEVAPSPDQGGSGELGRLRQRIAELETRLADKSASDGGVA